MFFRNFVVQQSKRGALATLRSVDKVANVRKWWFFVFHTLSNHFSKQKFTKWGVLKAIHWSSRGLKNFSTHRQHPLFVLGMFVRNFVVQQSKRDALATRKSVDKVANVRKWWFFRFYTLSNHFSKQKSTKRGVLKTSHWSSRALKNFSTHRKDPLLVLEMFFRNFVVQQSKRSALATHRSVDKVANVRKWWFFDFHTLSNHFSKQKSTKRGVLKRITGAREAWKNFLRTVRTHYLFWICSLGTF